MACKILVAADLDCNLNLINKKLEKFDFVLCLGKTLQNNEILSNILTGELKLKKPIYFIDDGDLRNLLTLKFPSGGEIASNLHYLGNFGIKIIKGYTIAYFSSLEQIIPSYKSFDENRARLARKMQLETHDEIYKKMKKNHEDLENGRPVDIFISGPTPNLIEEDETLREIKAPKSEILNKLALILQPRYHICSGKEMYYARKPYINYDDHLRPIHVTRLLYLASFPTIKNKSKGKYLYAFQTHNLPNLSEDKRNERPDDTTENPYLRYRESKENDEDNNASEIKAERLVDQDIFSRDFYQLSEKDKEKIENLKNIQKIYVGGFSS